MKSSLSRIAGRDGVVGRCGRHRCRRRTSCSAICSRAAGPFATLASTNEIAAQMAVEEINAAGGVNGKKLKIISFDTAGKPEQAVVGVRKLAEDDKVMAIIGPFSSGECRVAFPAGERSGVVMMSMASSAPKLAEPFTYGLRNTSDEGYMFRARDEDAEGQELPDRDRRHRLCDRRRDLQDHGRDRAAEHHEGGRHRGRRQRHLPEPGVRPSAQVSQLKATPTDLIGVGSGPEAAMRLAQELRRQGHNGRLVAGSTIADSELASRMGASGNGTVIPTDVLRRRQRQGKKFEEEFVKRAKAAGIERSAASQFDAATYDIVLFYAHAMKEGKVTGDPAKLAAERTTVRDVLRAMPPFPALEGPISFGKNGDALKPVYIIEMQDGKWNLLATYPAGQ